MGQIITRSCDYEGCDQTETITANYEFRVIEEDEEFGIVEDAPAETVGDILWCDYEPDAFPQGRYLCREHERRIRTERGIKLYARMS